MEEILINRVREIRARFRITQDDLAKAISVSRQTIISIEGGEYNPSIILSLKIAKVFKMKVEDIFYLSKGEEKNELFFEK